MSVFDLHRRKLVSAGLGIAASLIAGPVLSGLKREYSFALESTVHFATDAVTYLQEREAWIDLKSLRAVREKFIERGWLDAEMEHKISAHKHESCYFFANHWAREQWILETQHLVRRATAHGYSFSQRKIDKRHSSLYRLPIQALEHMPLQLT